MMSRSAVSSVQHVHDHTASSPFSIIRTETVLSRFPIHNLAKRGAVSIRITQTAAQGRLDLLWAVSSNSYYGQPGPLAYQLDTLIINAVLDTLPRPLPGLIRLGSLRAIEVDDVLDGIAVSLVFLQ